MANALDKKDKVWIFFMDLFSGICHQMPERSYFIGDYQMPLCVRCFGIRIGEISAIILLLFRIKINIYLSIFFIAIMAIDGSLQYFNILKSTNMRRLISGILAGLGYVNVVWFVVMKII